MPSLLETVRDIIISEGCSDTPINETIIAERVGYSRTPVREVLHYLEEEGLILRRPGVGIKLRKPTEKEIVDVYDLRGNLEGLACRLLADNMQKSVVSNLRKANMDLERTKSYHDAEKKDVFFHQMIIEHCGNRRLIRVVKNLHIITVSFNMFRNVPDQDWSTRILQHPHGTIIDAIESRNPEEAEKAMRLHIMEAKANSIRLFEKTAGNDFKKEVI